jgi:cysteine desulfurase
MMVQASKHIYLDHNATTPVLPEVALAFVEAMRQPTNASSIHASGRRARKLVEEARAAVRTLTGASEAYDVIFTASGTEANNLALQGFPPAVTRIVSAVEHVSVLKAVKDAILCPVDEKGIIRLDALRRLLENNAGKKALVSIQLANNETGIIQPVNEVADLVYSFHGYVHADTAQGFGKIPVSIQELNVDMLTISAHKFGGPLGAAALVAKKGLPLTSMLHGGGQELGFRAGTENAPAILGFGIAASLEPGYRMGMQKVQKLRDAMEDEILSTAPDALVVGKGQARLPNTSSIIMPGMHQETQLIAFDLDGLAVSAGSACSSGKVEVSHVLRAMQVPEELAPCAIRISLGPDTTKEDIAQCIHSWKKLYAKAKSKQAA